MLHYPVSLMNRLEVTSLMFSNSVLYISRGSPFQFIKLQWAADSVLKKKKKSLIIDDNTLFMFPFQTNRNQFNGSPNDVNEGS